MENEFQRDQAFVPYPIQEMPPEISDALFGKGAPEIRREIPAADEPFGIFAKVTPLPADPDIDEPFDYEHPLTKLLASDMPAVSYTHLDVYKRQILSRANFIRPVTGQMKF